MDRHYGSVVMAHTVSEYGVTPDVIIDLGSTPIPSANASNTSHRHVVIGLDDGSELWLDISTDLDDHNFADIRWFNPAGEMKGTGAFTIVNGRRLAFDQGGTRDTEGRVVQGHGWAGGYVMTLLVDKNGAEKTAIKPSNGNG